MPGPQRPRLIEPDDAIATLAEAMGRSTPAELFRRPLEDEAQIALFLAYEYGATMRELATIAHTGRGTVERMVSCVRERRRNSKAFRERTNAIEETLAEAHPGELEDEDDEEDRAAGGYQRPSRLGV